MLIVLLVVVVVLATVADVLAVTAADVLAISGTRTIEPGRAFGIVMLDAGEILGDSDTVAGVEIFVVVLVIDVAAALHVSCTGTTKAN